MDDDFAAYQKVLSTGRFKHSTLKPGDELSMPDSKWWWSARTEMCFDHALPGAGQPNPYCKATSLRARTRVETRSLGTVLTFGKLRILDLGDLTWDKEMELMCPNNKLGKIDIYVVSRSWVGREWQPRAGRCYRSTRRGNGQRSDQRRLGQGMADDRTSAPGLETLWQLHYAEKGGKDHNVDEAYIANEGTADEGNYIKIAAHQDGSFTVFNSRNKLVKTYAAR